MRNVNINRSTGRLPFTPPFPVHHVVHPEDLRHSALVRLLTIDSGRPIGELRRRAVRRCPYPPHVFLFRVAGEEELIVPPHPTAPAQRAPGRVLEAFEFRINLPNGDEAFWVNREDAAEHHLILSSELVQFEDIVVVIAGNQMI